MPKIEEWQRYTWTRQDKDELDNRLRRIEYLITKRRQPIRHLWRTTRRLHRLLTLALAKRIENFTHELLDWSATRMPTETVWFEDGRINIRTGEAPRRLRREADLGDQEPPLGHLSYYDQPPEERKYDFRLKIRGVPVFKNQTDDQGRRRLIFPEKTIMEQLTTAMQDQATRRRAELAQKAQNDPNRQPDPGALEGSLVIDVDVEWSEIRKTNKRLAGRRT